jgi:hypothetical protein
MQHYEQGHTVRSGQPRRNMEEIVAGLPAGCICQRGARGCSESTPHPTHPPQGPRSPIRDPQGPTSEKIAHQSNVSSHGCAAVSQHAKRDLPESRAPSGSPYRNAPIRCVVHTFSANGRVGTGIAALSFAINDSGIAKLAASGMRDAVPAQIPQDSCMTLAISLIAANG